MNLDSIKTWVSNLPSPVRHFLAVLLATILASETSALVAHGGLSGFDWHAPLSEGFNKGILLGLVAIGVLALTPLTSAFGVGKTPVDPPVPPV